MIMINIERKRMSLIFTSAPFSVNKLIIKVDLSLIAKLSGDSEIEK